MSDYKVIAIATNIAGEVRASGKAPSYGHPAHIEIAKGYGPCRHCLRPFQAGVESRTLFTYNSFEGVEEVPLPGPVFIHTAACERYPEQGGYPADLLRIPAVMLGYAKGQTLLHRELVDPGGQMDAIEKLFANPEVDYIEVRDRKAGCYTFRIERAGSRRMERLASDRSYT